MRKIKVDLSVQGIDAAISFVEQEKAKLIEDIKRFLNYLVQNGATFARSKVVNIDTGATKRSIKGMVINRNKAVIVAGANAIWLEFGTGVDRNPTNYPDPLPNGINQHKSSTRGGWYYPSTDDRYCFVVTTKEGEELSLAFTHGIAANKFMFQTKQMLIHNTPEWARDFFEGLEQ